MSFFTADQFSGRKILVATLVKMEFVSKTVCLWNGEYRITIGGDVFLPMHGIGSIEGLGESAGGDSEAVTLKLSGIPSDNEIFALAFEETPEANQQLLTIYTQFFNTHWQPEGDKICIFWGFMQPPRIGNTSMTETEGSVQELTISAENAFFNRSRPPFGRYTDKDQQYHSLGDRFFQFVSKLLFKTFNYPDF